MAAYCFDSAVSRFGSELQSALEGVKGKTDKARAREQERVIQRWIPEAKQSKRSQFRDPANAKV